jgi:hypothetical protein
MKKKKSLLLAVLVCFLSILACKSWNDNSTPTPVNTLSPEDLLKAGEMTREFLIMQTVIAGEEVTQTPTAVTTSVPPAQWTELFTRTPTKTKELTTPTPQRTMTPGWIYPTQGPTATPWSPRPTQSAPTDIPTQLPTPIPPTSLPPTQIIPTQPPPTQPHPTQAPTEPSP